MRSSVRQAPHAIAQGAVETTTYFGVGVTDEGRNVIDAIPNGKAGVDFCFPDLGYNEGALATELNRYFDLITPNAERRSRDG